MTDTNDQYPYPFDDNSVAQLIQGKELEWYIPPGYPMVVAQEHISLFVRDARLSHGLRISTSREAILDGELWRVVYFNVEDQKGG